MTRSPNHRFILEPRNATSCFLVRLRREKYNRIETFVTCVQLAILTPLQVIPENVTLVFNSFATFLTTKA